MQAQEPTETCDDPLGLLAYDCWAQGHNPHSDPYRSAPLDSAETQPCFPPTPHPDQCPTVPVVVLGTQSSGQTPTGLINASASPKVGSDRARACRQGTSP